MPYEDVRPASTEAFNRDTDRRARLRIDVLGQIDAHSVGQSRPLYLRELSEAGFSLEATSPFERDLIHAFRIGTDHHGPAVIVEAKMRHCMVASKAGALPIYVTGFELVNASDSTLREIRSLLRFADPMWEEV